MSRLARLQGAFQDYLLHADPAIEQRVLGTARVPAATRLGIYAGAYRARLAEALESNFPALARLLGASDFHDLAAAYVAAHDSRHFSIRWYGDQLPQFLAAHEAYASAPLLAELARWEWAVSLVFDAADAVPLTHRALERTAPAEWAQLRFRWHPSVQRLELSWNVPQLWQALEAGSERPAAALAAAPQPWLLWREQLRTRFRSLPVLEAAALDAVRRGWPFGELCGLLCDELGEAAAPPQAATLLRGWIENGLIVGIA